MAPPPHEITQLLQAWSTGDRKALDQLMPLVYDDLRRVAHRHMAGERDPHTLQTTALVNEVYLRLVDSKQATLKDRAHFFAISARAMRQILVDSARSRRALKRGADVRLIELDETIAATAVFAGDLIALDDALNALAAFDTRKGQVLEMRIFGGLSAGGDRWRLADFHRYRDARHDSLAAARTGPGEPPWTAERWREIERIYNLALEQPADRRSTFLEQICAGDYELRQEVESLLAHAEGAEEFVNAAAQAIAGMPGDSAGMAIGRYSLLQKIGEGGMGEVWLAEQREPVRRRVALKLVKAGMNTREVMARFESERQALALMDHPGIAKVFEAGTTPQGAPYFAMEYVAGVPITEYCDNHKLSTRERLELFMQVCEAVQHAHQKAIIHRDLKPSNILVMEADGRAAPKIIDFGVAKALTQRLSLDTVFTRVGTLLGTPAYMSPEQAGSSGENIDTRTDVYSLGVIFTSCWGVPPQNCAKSRSRSSCEDCGARAAQAKHENPYTGRRDFDGAGSQASNRAARAD